MKQVLVETSARHIHLSREAVDALFGVGYELTNKKDLSQPGQYACAEKLVVVGPKGSLKASILGPTRPASQVEISLTDARSIGVKAPIRESGDIAGSGACKLVNPDTGAELELAEGVIAAKRHIHLTPEAAAEIAKEFGIRIYTIGVGTNNKTAPFPYNGTVVNVPVEIDETTLKNIADITNGKYYRATSKESLGEIYNEIDKLERTKLHAKQFSAYNEEYHIFALIALLALLFEIILRNTVLRKIP